MTCAVDVRDASHTCLESHCSSSGSAAQLKVTHCGGVGGGVDRVGGGLPA